MTWQNSQAAMSHALYTLQTNQSHIVTSSYWRVANTTRRPVYPCVTPPYQRFDLCASLFGSLSWLAAHCIICMWHCFMLYYIDITKTAVAVSKYSTYYTSSKTYLHLHVFFRHFWVHVRKFEMQVVSREHQCLSCYRKLYEDKWTWEPVAV